MLHYRRVFSDCLIKKAVFLEKAGCTLWKISWAWRPIDQILLWIGRCSCSRFPLAINVTPFGASCPELSDVSLFWFSVRMTVIAAIWRQFWTSSLRAITQINISRLSVLGTLTSLPEHPSMSKILAQFCIRDLFFGVDVPLSHWLVCQLLREVCRAFQNCFWLALFEGIVRSSGFLRNLHLYSRTSYLSLVTFVFSTNASVVCWFGIHWRLSSAARARLANQSLSTVGARAEKCSFATQA